MYLELLKDVIEFLLACFQCGIVITLLEQLLEFSHLLLSSQKCEEFLQGPNTLIQYNCGKNCGSNFHTP
jgi:hypothetical protein